jgi:tRNA-guanine family transglycosylase
MAKVQFKTASEILGARLHTLHNLYYYQSLMQGLRAAIEARQLDQFSKHFYAEVAPDLRIRARIETFEIIYR